MPYKNKEQRTIYYHKHKEEINVKRRNFYLKNKDKISCYSKKYREENGDKIKKSRIKYSQNHKEQIKIRGRKYHQEHKEERNIKRKRYYLEHKKECNIKGKEYYLQNKDKILYNNKKYRERNIEVVRQRYRDYYYKVKRAGKIIKKRPSTEEQKKKIAIRKKLYYQKNKEKRKIRAKVYRIENKEKIKERHRIWYQLNKLKINKKRVEDRNVDTVKRFRHNLSALIREKLKRRLLSKNGKSAFSFLPYTVNDLIQHLENNFKSGMSWNNYGKGEGYWNIDHIVADCKFNYKSVEDKEFQKCWALKNLQPLWATENWIKNRF